jgi:hypothetical protein
MAMSKVLVNFIQDRSGSMASVWDETVSGFKSFVEELRDKGKKDGVEYLLSLTTFDTVVESPLKGAPIGDVDLDILKQHGPRGATALYDAVGATIENTDKDRHGADKIICVIVTDGQENSSREWDKDKLNRMVESHLNAGDWTFTYLGTQPETWDDAGAIGIAAGATASYTPKMAAQAYHATASAVACLASSERTSSHSLMSDYVGDAQMASAGMGRGPTSKTTTHAPIPPKRSRKVPSGKWR